MIFILLDGSMDFRLALVPALDMVFPNFKCMSSSSLCMYMVKKKVNLNSHRAQNLYNINIHLIILSIYLCAGKNFYTHVHASEIKEFDHKPLII